MKKFFCLLSLILLTSFSPLQAQAQEGFCEPGEPWDYFDLICEMGNWWPMHLAEAGCQIHFGTSVDAADIALDTGVMLVYCQSEDSGSYGGGGDCSGDAVC